MQALAGPPAVALRPTRTRELEHPAAPAPEQCARCGCDQLDDDRYCPACGAVSLDDGRWVAGAGPDA